MPGSTKYLACSVVQTYCFYQLAKICRLHHVHGSTNRIMRGRSIMIREIPFQPFQLGFTKLCHGSIRLAIRQHRDENKEEDLYQGIDAQIFPSIIIRAQRRIKKKFFDFPVPGCFFLFFFYSWQCFHVDQNKTKMVQQPGPKKSQNAVANWTKK